MGKRLWPAESLRNLRHNLVTHPLAGLCWFFGWQALGDWLHENG